jgi:hypothetical protein
VPPGVLGTGGTHSVPEEAGHRVDPAGFEFVTQHIAFDHRHSVPRAVAGRGRCRSGSTKVVDID